MRLHLEPYLCRRRCRSLPRRRSTSALVSLIQTLVVAVVVDTVVSTIPTWGSRRVSSPCFRRCWAQGSGWTCREMVGVGADTSRWCAGVAVVSNAHVDYLNVKKH